MAGVLAGAEMILALLRDDNPSNRHNYGKFFVDGKYLCESLEDTDRRLESGGEKVQDDTAIPRGRYKVTATQSKRFGRLMPEVHNVPQFTGVRLHGGNTEVDTHGCPLLGQYRTDAGIADCSVVNLRLLNFLLAAECRNEEVWLEVS